MLHFANELPFPAPKTFVELCLKHNKLSELTQAVIEKGFTEVNPISVNNMILAYRNKGIKIPTISKD